MKTKHNSNDMKTVVETYVVEETQELIYDDEQLEKWNALVEELSLQGQTAIVKPTKSPIPFLHLAPALKNTFETLCPVKANIEQYNISPIPVEILSLAALAKREGYFEKIEIWYDDKAVDPACVGVVYGTFYAIDNKGMVHTACPTKAEAQAIMDANGIDPKYEPYGCNERYYILGRWGDVKRSFDELIKRARAKYITLKAAEFKRQIKVAERMLADVEIKADEMFQTTEVPGDLPF